MLYLQEKKSILKYLKTNKCENITNLHHFPWILNKFSCVPYLISLNGIIQKSLYQIED